MFPPALMGILTRAACQLGEGAGSKIGTPRGSLALKHSQPSSAASPSCTLPPPTPPGGAGLLTVEVQSLATVWETGSSPLWTFSQLLDPLTDQPL